MPQQLNDSGPKKEFSIHFLAVIAIILLILGSGIALLIFGWQREQNFSKRVQEVNLEKEQIRLQREKSEADAKRASEKLAQNDFLDQLRIFKEVFSIRNTKFNTFINQSSLLLTNQTGRYVAGSDQYFLAAFTLFQTNTLKIASPAAVRTMMEASRKLERQIQVMTNGFVPSPELSKALRHDIQWLQEQITFIDSAQTSLNAIEKGIESEIRAGLKPAPDTLDVAVQRRDYSASIKRKPDPEKEALKQDLLRRYPSLGRPSTNR